MALTIKLAVVLKLIDHFLIVIAVAKEFIEISAQPSINALFNGFILHDEVLSTVALN